MYFCLGRGSFKRAEKSFLFTLVNPVGLPPTQMLLMNGQEDRAMYCHTDYGPTFGGENFHDLHIINEPTTSLHFFK